MTASGEKSRIQSQRRELSKRRGEPVQTVERSLQQYGRSLYVNVPSLSTKILNLDSGEDVSVEQHDDRIVIRPEVDDA